MEYVKIQGLEIPALGLGTARMAGSECRNAVKDAMELGYRHIDTAQMYDNEEVVGEAVSASSVDREDIFLTTKIHRKNLSRRKLKRSFENSLQKLGTDYVDLLLIHAPSPSVPLEETLETMNHLQEEGKVRFIGVSNFRVERLEKAIEKSETPVITDQVRYNPYYSQDEVLEFCRENDILLTAYSPLAVGEVVGDSELAEIGKRYRKSAAQVALRWLVQQENVATVPKAARHRHLKENIEIFDFELSEEEMNTVHHLSGGIINRIRDRFRI